MALCLGVVKWRSYNVNSDLLLVKPLYDGQPRLPLLDHQQREVIKIQDIESLESRTMVLGEFNYAGSLAGCSNRC